MLRTRITLLAVALAFVCILPPAASAADRLAPAAEWASPNAIVVLEVSSPSAVLDTVLSPAFIEAVKSWGAYKALAAKPDFMQFQTLVQGLELRLATDWQTAVRTLLGDGITLVLGPGESRLLIVDSQDARMLAELHEVFLAIARGEAAKQGQPDRVTSTAYGDVTGWSFGPNEAHALVGRRLLVANGPAALKAALDLRAKAGGANLASAQAYRQAIEAAGADADIRLYANTAVLKQVPKIANALSAKGNPLLSLLLAGVTEAVQDSTWLALGLEIKGDTLVLDATTDGTIGESGVARFALPVKPGDSAVPNLVTPRRIAGMSLYRELGRFYAAKDDLFPERTSGLIFFENMMGIFFTGRDLTDEVLAETGPHTRIVVAEQEYDPAIGTPAARFPAFAVVFELNNPEHFAKIAEEAWQKAIGLVNFTRGQKAQPGLIIDRSIHNGTTYTVAYFTPDDVQDKTSIDTRFNFRPSLAVVDNYLIVSSTDGLTEDLIDAIRNGSADAAKPRAGTHSLLEVNGPQLASILAANRESMILKNMVEKGHFREQAENEFAILLAVAEHVTRAELAVLTDDARSKASLTLNLRIPGVE